MWFKGLKKCAVVEEQRMFKLTPVIQPITPAGLETIWAVNYRSRFEMPDSPRFQRIVSTSHCDLKVAQ